MSIIKDENNVPEFLSRIKKLSNKAIHVGIFGDEDSEVLLYASVHEFGAPSINVPERSFLRKTVDAKLKDIKETTNEFVIKYLEGSNSYDDTIDILGEYYVGLVRKMIVDVDSPPLKIETIRRKGSSNPLVDTGRMIETVAYRVVDI